ERLRTMFRGPNGLATPEFPAPRRPRDSKPGDPELVSTRQSRGLEQFFFDIRDHVGLSILDLAGATQENINYITNLGHKIYTQDFIRSLDDTFNRDDASDQSNVSRIDYFLRQNLEFPEETFDAVLVWDVLQYLSPALLTATLDRLLRIVRPKSYLLAFFNADEKSKNSPSYTFRIQNQSTLAITQRGSRKQAQVFNNRSLEKLFNRFESVKFFLTRESLREVIVRR
ncbi:MAG: class I SAM-dependent methyltransferase, partial [Acidobacteriota bacterium]|nr:class I SAM-dependent methyltransferase [Acidobacteriota bacterium]